MFKINVRKPLTNEERKEIRIRNGIKDIQELANMPTEEICLRKTSLWNNLMNIAFHNDCAYEDTEGNIKLSAPIGHFIPETELRSWLRAAWAYYLGIEKDNDYARSGAVLKLISTLEEMRVEHFSK